MSLIEGYLDLNLLLNGAMDAFLLVLTGRLLHYPVRKRRIGGGVLLGAVPVVLALWPHSVWCELSKVVTPLAMVWASFPWQGWRKYGKALVGFSLLSAGLGGLIYALWGWSEWDGSYAGQSLRLVLGNLWLLPLAAVLWWGGQTLWQRWQMKRLATETILFNLEIDFGETGKRLEVKALLDTGNQLYDPMTQKPVILLEEEVAREALPPLLRAVLEGPWRQSSDPWNWLVGQKPELLSQVVMIPFQTIERKSWIVGIRPMEICLWESGAGRDHEESREGREEKESEKCREGRARKRLKATIGLVPQILNKQGEYQALMHPELQHAD